MQSKLVRALAIGAFVVGAWTIAKAQQNVPSGQSADLGKSEYDAHCAVCHGLAGKGDGPSAKALKDVVADLTVMSKKNNGMYPYKHVYDTIMGFKPFLAHGTKDMPIWGLNYYAESYSRNPYYDPQGYAFARVLALTEYIYRLQQK